LLKNTHLPFDRLMALSGSTSLTVLSKSKDKAEGLRCPHPSSLRRTGLYVSLLGLPAAGRDFGRLVSERF